MLIWLPDMSQAALNALAHGAHRRLAADGALDRAASPFAVCSREIPNTALEAIRALEKRGALRRKRGSAHLRPACLAPRSCA